MAAPRETTIRIAIAMSLSTLPVRNGGSSAQRLGAERPALAAVTSGHDLTPGRSSGL